MSVDLMLDRTHDLAASGSGDLALVDGAARVRQQIEITLRTFLGEWFLDDTWGIPYLDKILAKAPKRAEIEAIIRAKVMDVPDVTAVPAIEIEVDAQTRQGRITLTDIETDQGLVTVSVTR